MEKIVEFTGDNFFLSNFYLLSPPIVYEGISYISVEHAFQAAKTLDADARYGIAILPTPAFAKRVGRHLVLRADWEKVKIDVMRELLHKKFEDSRLLKRLLATGDADLIEGNWWTDRFWGVQLPSGIGENHLGRLLMELRKEKSSS